MNQRLKSLELQGYKTFAIKTRFEFPDQITAIVGPNGSGKSNIADSVRWVLGEQAYSLLRGKKTIDMIFTGSELRPRASMASVTIVFNNEDNWLPIDYSEVSLTRRAYRSGENEYLLNNTRVRLKEINELLANSGLSERTYTIIGQGLVDSALSVKPEERRRFFEEAAGIELYRSRRDEAIQKLDNTRRNMERAEDILSELIPRLKSLEKQAERAKEFERIKSDLFVSLRDWYGFQWNKMQEELSYSQEMQKLQDKNLADARDNQAEIDKRIGEIRNEINKTRTELGKWHQQSSELHLNEEQGNREMAVLEERKIALIDKTRDIQHQITVSEEEIKSRQGQLDELKKEKNNKVQEYSKALKSFELISKKIVERQTERKRFEEELNNHRSMKEKQETKQVQLSAQIDELDQRIVLLEDNLNEIIFANKKDIGESGDLEKQITLVKQNIDQLDREKEETNKKITHQNLLILGIEDQLSHINEKINQAEAKKVSLITQLDVLEQAEQSLSGFSSGSKALFEAIKKGKLTGRYELLLSNIQVSAEYEVAIASVLGEILEAIVLDEKTNPDKALDFLQDSESGRTALLPKAWITEPENHFESSEKGAVRANEVIRTTNAYQPIIDSLLSNVIIVTDRRIARKIITSNKSVLKVVTLQGEVFYPNGTIIAGKEARVRTISRKREKDDLALRIKETEDQIKELNDQYARIDKDLGEKQKTLDELVKKKNEIEAKSGQFNDELNSLSITLKQLSNKVNWQDEQRKSIEQQLKNGKKNKVLLINGKQENGEKITQIKNKIEESFGHLKDLQVENLQQELFDTNSTRAVAEQVLNDITLRVSENQKLHDEFQNEFKSLKKRLVECEKSIKELDIQITELKKKEILFEKELKRLDEQIIPAEKKLAELDIKQQELMKEQEQRRQHYTVIERHSIQAQMKNVRMRELQDSLIRRIEEDFGLVSYEYAQANEGPNPLPIEGMVENLPKLKTVPEDLEETIKQQKSLLRRMGPINPEAQKEYKEVQERHQFISDQLKDLDKAESDLRQVVTELDSLMKTEFEKTFQAVGEEFRNIFEILFGGGSAKLIISDEENISESGIEIEATLPGKRKQELASLSGGERSLTAVALIFALLKVSPTPFCILDEVDAMLDESNVMRFGELLRGLSTTTQFIVITHNRNTVQLANVLYGVTMSKDSTSQVISLKLDELTEEMVQ